MRKVNNIKELAQKLGLSPTTDKILGLIIPDIAAEVIMNGKSAGLVWL